MSSLIDVADLERVLADPELVLLDVRWRLAGPPGRDSYASAHLPGAVFVDLDDELASTPGDRGRHPLPDPTDLEVSLRRAGVGSGSRVVVYDDGDLVAAARAWWVLRWAGLRSVQVLDGGFAAWSRDGLATSTEQPVPTAGDVEVRPGGMPVLDADAAARLARGGVLVDARQPVRFRGEAEPIDPVAGRIPHAVNVPSAALVREQGGLRSPDELRREFDSVGVGEAVEVGAYCGSGVTAAQTVLALDVIGVRAALYPGSWSEWIRDPNRPVQRG